MPVGYVFLKKAGRDIIAAQFREVHVSQLKPARPRVLSRNSDILTLILIRAVTAYLIPNLFMQAKLVESQLNSFVIYPMSDLFQVRVTLQVW